MSVAILFSTVFTFSDMVVVYVLTRGGPFDTTHVLASMAYFKGIFGGNLSVGAAISLFLFPILLAGAISHFAHGPPGGGDLIMSAAVPS